MALGTTLSFGIKVPYHQDGNTIDHALFYTATSDPRESATLTDVIYLPVLFSFTTDGLALSVPSVKPVWTAEVLYAQLWGKGSELVS